MGVEFKLTDRELPVSPDFINFLAQTLAGKPFEHEIWADQRSETLVPGGAELIQRATDAAAFVMGSAAGREQVARAYSLLFCMLTGDMAPLQELQAQFHFVNFIGIPRTGGSYLTAELYRALGMAPERVPSALAHDSFPDAGPFELRPGINSWMLSLKTMAEYLIMVEMFFGGQKPHFGKIVVPKKLTKCAYAGGFFLRALGERAEQTLTVRHPVASCLSTYEKSGGLPADGLFRVRSNIEEWCRRDLRDAGCAAEALERMDYFEAYLRYWEHYYRSLVATGLAAGRDLRVIPFSRHSLQSTAQSYHDRYGSGLRAADFQISDRARTLHPEWIDRSQEAIGRVAAAWSLAGIQFPAAQIGACW